MNQGPNEDTPLQPPHHEGDPPKAEADSSNPTRKTSNALSRMADRLRHFTTGTPDELAAEDEAHQASLFEAARLNAEGLNQTLCFILEKIAQYPKAPDDRTDTLRAHTTQPDAKNPSSAYLEWLACLSAGSTIQEPEAYRVPLAGPNLGELHLDHPLASKSRRVPLYTMDIALHMKAGDSPQHPAVSGTITFNLPRKEFTKQLNDAGTAIPRTVVVETNDDGEIESVRISSPRVTGLDAISLQGLSSNIDEILYGIESLIDTTTKAYKSFSSLDQPES